MTEEQQQRHAAAVEAYLRRIAEAADAMHGMLTALYDTAKGHAKPGAENADGEETRW